MRNEGWQKTVGIYSGAAFLSLAILTWVMQLWRADLTVPFGYLREGDVFLYLVLTKGLLDNGWYLHNSYVGAPTGLDFYDYPFWDALNFLFLKFLSLGTTNYAVVHNLYFLLTFPLTTLTSLWVFRQFHLSTSTALFGSILFAFLPYHFYWGEVHYNYAIYYTVPLAVLVILWVSLGIPLFCRTANEGEKFTRKWIRPKALVSIMICVLVASSSGIYYAFFAGFFLLIAGVSTSFKQRSIQPLVTAGILLAVLGLGFTVNVLPNLLYILQHGRNQEVAKRSPQESEIYGMKIAQLMLPISDHRLSALRSLKEKYSRTAPLVNENDFASLGIVGSSGFLMLLGFLILKKPQGPYSSLLENLSIYNGAGILLATIGGFSSLFALLITPQIRCYNRISVYIAFFSLFAVVLLLEQAKRKLAESKASAYFFDCTLGFVLLIGILDQVPKSFAVLPYEQLKAAYTSDADFVQHIEAVTGENAMIAQLPYVSFPEQPLIPNALFRGYLHSRTLRWSYGAMRGRTGGLWQQYVFAKPIDEMLETLAFAGFRGIYLDRAGYVDNGAGVERELSARLGNAPLVSKNNRLVFFDMAQFIHQLREPYTDEEWQLKRDIVLQPILLQWKNGFSDLEGTQENNWRWCSSSGELHIENSSQRQRKLSLEMSVATGYEEPSLFRIESPWFAEEILVNAIGHSWKKEISVPPGKHAIRFVSAAKRVDAPTDPRVLVFRVVNFHFEERE